MSSSGWNIRHVTYCFGRIPTQAWHCVSIIILSLVMSQPKTKSWWINFFLHPSEVTSQGKKGSLKSLSGQQRVLIWLPACLSTMFFMLQRSVRGTRILLIGGAHSQTRPLSPAQTSRHTHRSRRCPVKFTPLRSETTDSYTPHTLCCLGSAWFL